MIFLLFKWANSERGTGGRSGQRSPASEGRAVNSGLRVGLAEVIGRLGKPRSASADPLGDRAGSLERVDLLDPHRSGARASCLRRGIDDNDVGEFAPPQAIGAHQLSVAPALVRQNLCNAVVIYIGVLAPGAATATPTHPDPRPLARARIRLRG
jgi:hypothetical protein